MKRLAVGVSMLLFIGLSVPPAPAGPIELSATNSDSFNLNPGNLSLAGVDLVAGLGNLTVTVGADGKYMIFGGGGTHNFIGYFDPGIDEPTDSLFNVTTVNVTTAAIVESAVGSAVGTTVGSAGGSSIGSTIGSVVGSGVGSAVGTPVAVETGESVGPGYYGGNLSNNLGDSTLANGNGVPGFGGDVLDNVFTVSGWDSTLQASLSEDDLSIPQPSGFSLTQSNPGSTTNTFFSNGSVDVQVTATPGDVSTPSTLLLMSTGLVIAIIRRRLK